MVAAAAYGAHVVDGAAEAVEVAAQGREALEHLEHLRQPFAAVDDDGQGSSVGKLKLLLEHNHLLALVGGVPVQVDADFTHGDVVAAVSPQLVKDILQTCLPVGGVEFLGVQTHRHARVVGPLRGKGTHGGDAVDRDVGQNHTGDAGVEGALHHLGAVGVELGHVWVRVRVGEVRHCAVLPSVHQFTRVASDRVRPVRISFSSWPRPVRLRASRAMLL